MRPNRILCTPSSDRLRVSSRVCVQIQIIENYVSARRRFERIIAQCDFESRAFYSNTIGLGGFLFGRIYMTYYFGEMYMCMYLLLPLHRLGEFLVI